VQVHDEAVFEQSIPVAIDPCPIVPLIGAIAALDALDQFVEFAPEAGMLPFPTPATSWKRMA
jgi:hypothetical protein